MSTTAALRLLTVALAASALALPAPAVATVTPDQAAALGGQAYLYGLPLLESLRVRATATSVRCPDGRGNAPVNAFSTVTRFATPASRTVVAPNVDTLYSTAHLDLGRGPVVLSHPDMGERYFSFQLLDPYTNTVGYVGSRTTGGRAGRFAIAWADGPRRRVRGATVLRVPSRRIWVIGRTVASTRADQRAAVRLMRRYELAPPGGPRRFPAPCRPGPPEAARTPAGVAFVDALNAALTANPPPPRDRPLLDELAAVGIGPGLRFADADLTADARAALVAAVQTTATGFPALARASVTAQAAARSGWAIPADHIGDYGTDYTYRAGVALIGLGANTREEAVYPTAYLDADGRPLDGRQRYRIVFAPGEAPPARAFWSLTMYDADGYLVRNRARRHAIGDTHPPLVRRPDGSIVVVMQRGRPVERAVNWLPTPAGPFRLNLRVYDPRPSVLDGRWRPPPVQRAGP